MKRLIVALLGLAISCQTPKKELKIENEVLEASRCVGGNCAEVSIKWPRVSEFPNSEGINDLLIQKVMGNLDTDNPQESIEEQIESFLSDYEEVTKEFPDYPAGWTLTIEGELTYQSDSVLSFDFIEGNYSGGAHPNSSDTFLNIDAISGERLTDEQLVLDRGKLLEMARRGFRSYHDVPDSLTIEQDDRFFIPDSGFFLPQAKGFKEGKFWLVYNPYEIAPYVFGYTYLSFELSEIEGVVRK